LFWFLSKSKLQTRFFPLTCHSQESLPKGKVPKRNTRGGRGLFFGGEFLGNGKSAQKLQLQTTNNNRKAQRHRANHQQILFGALVNDHLAI
jgi:hypothetical protein